MRYVRVLGGQCAPHDALTMQRWIAHPLPPPDVLGPACAHPSLAMSLDMISGTPSSTLSPQQLAHGQHDASTCVIELPKWAQRDIARSLYQITECDGRSGGGKRVHDDRKVHGASCDDGATGHAWPWPSPGTPDNADSSADLGSPVTAAHTPSMSHYSTGSLPHSWSVRHDPAHCPVLPGLHNQQQPQRPASVGLLERMLMRGLPLQCRSTASAGAPSCTMDDSEV